MRSDPVGGAPLHPCEACLKTGIYQRIFEKWGYPIWRCAACGLQFCSPPAPGKIQAIYDKNYFEGGRPDGYAGYSASEPVLRREFQNLAKWLYHRSGPGRLLEIGSAYGFFLLEAQNYFAVEGIETSEAAAAVCRDRGLTVRTGDLLSLELPLRAFQAIVLLDTVEHLLHPHNTLRRVFELMQPGGRLLITTGDVDSLISRISGRHWRLLTPPQHLYYFSRTSLSTLLTAVGFSDIEVDYPWKTVPLNLMAYQLFSRSGLKTLAPKFSSSIGLPVNLFDAMRVIARKPLPTAADSKNAGLH
jgi:SAM-dependent methyltransferase